MDRPVSQPESPDRRGFLSRASTVAMFGGLVAAYGTLAGFMGRFLYPARAQTRDWISYDLPAALVPKVWNGHFRGQTQMWFAMRFLGRDVDIDIDTRHPEFDAWKWSRIENLPEMIVPFKQALYVELVRQFKPLADTLAAGGDAVKS